jgi:hypothetical protein
VPSAGSSGIRLRHDRQSVCADVWSCLLCPWCGWWCELRPRAVPPAGFRPERCDGYAGAYTTTLGLAARGPCAEPPGGLETPRGCLGSIRRSSSAPTLAAISVPGHPLASRSAPIVWSLAIAP